MSARALLAVAHRMLVEEHGTEKVAEMLGPPDRTAARRARRAELAEIGIEVAS